MAVKTPVKATFTGSDVTGLAEYQAADFIGVADGGSGAVTFTAGILTADGTNAFTTVTAPSGTIVGTSDTQTLTNKTINSASNTITITESNISDLGSYITASSTDTLTNKSINLTNNTLSGTTAKFNTALSDGSFATLAGTETLTNKTISADNNTISGIAASSFVLSNGSGNIDGSASQKAIPSGDVIGTTDTQTLTNKTINSASNTLTLDLSEGTLTGTTAEFNTALSDGSFATLAGTETLTVS